MHPYQNMYMIGVAINGQGLWLVIGNYPAYIFFQFISKRLSDKVLTTFHCKKKLGVQLGIGVWHCLKDVRATPLLILLFSVTKILGLRPCWVCFFRLRRFQGYAPFYFDIFGYKDVRATPLFDVDIFCYEDVRATPLLILIFSVYEDSGATPFLILLFLGLRRWQG